MNIIDFFIARLRKIDTYKQFQIVETINKYKWKEYVSPIIEKGEIVIILDENGFYKDEINSMNGLVIEVQSVGLGRISMDYPNKPDEVDINIEDFRVIGLGFKENFANNSVRKQSMALGSSLIDFLLEDSKTININKYVLVSNKDILEHWALKTDIGILQKRNFKFVLVRE